MLECVKHAVQIVVSALPSGSSVEDLRDISAKTGIPFG
jgi:hypothetical protein